MKHIIIIMVCLESANHHNKFIFNIIWVLFKHIEQHLFYNLNLVDRLH